MNTKYFLAVFSFFLVVIFLTGCNQESQVITPDDSSLQKQLPSTEETEGLIYTALAEKLARDVYIHFSNTDYKVFENFQVIEQMHLDKVLRVIDKYDIDDPIGDSDVVGVFTDSNFQEMYNTYIAYAEPLEAGVAIETLIIDHLTYQLDEVVYKANIAVLDTCLLLSAQNHLLAFEN